MLSGLKAIGVGLRVRSAAHNVRLKWPNAPACLDETMSAVGRRAVQPRRMYHPFRGMIGCTVKDAVAAAARPSNPLLTLVGIELGVLLEPLHIEQVLRPAARLLCPNQVIS